MKNVEILHVSAFSSPAPSSGRHRHVECRIEIRPRNADGKAVRIE